MPTINGISLKTKSKSKDDSYRATPARSSHINPTLSSGQSYKPALVINELLSSRSDAFSDSELPLNPLSLVALYETTAMETLSGKKTDGLYASGAGSIKSSDVIRTLIASYSPPSMDLVENEDTIMPLRFMLKQAAPEALMSGVLLHRYSNAANCHEEHRTLVHRVHAWNVGAGELSDNHAVQFRTLLESHGIYLPTVDANSFYDNPELFQNSWDLAAYRVCLSYFPESYSDTILGALLFEVNYPLPSMLGASLSSYPSIKKSQYVDSRTDGDVSLMQTLCLDAINARLLALESTENEPDTCLQLIIRGFKTSAYLATRASNTIATAINAGYLSPSQEMYRLIKAKGKHAKGYHNKVKLAKIPLDQLITQAPDKFMTALAGSSWITPSDPDNSRFFKLLEFEQPMFRVFSDAETLIIRRWITSIPEQFGRVRDSNDIESKQADIIEKAIDDPSQIDNISHLPHNVKRQVVDNTNLNPEDNVRHLYHMLLNMELYPDTRHFALDFVKVWLARATREADSKNLKIPFDQYSHQALRGWFEHQGNLQSDSYSSERSKDIDKTREEVIEEAVFLCPMILVDGSWIQNWTAPGLVDTKIGSSLYKIFSDEIGNGDTDLNHPNVYRQLMSQMNVSILDHRTLDFANSDIFEDDAFMVPTFWMAISAFPKRFLPETLGLNLAMELSGVGGAYLKARDELAFYEFSTLFVDLHNTIDNVSTGHSALAAEAIVEHMDKILGTGDLVTIQRHWRRVWTGYRSLAIPRVSWKEIFARPAYNQ